MSIASIGLTRALRIAVGLILTTFVAAGCGNVTVGGYSHVSVDVSGDAPAATPAAPAPARQTAVVQMAAVQAPAASSPLRAEGEAEGEIEADFHLFLVSQTGASVELGNGDDIRVKIDVQGSTEAKPIENQLIPAGRYTELRIVFTKIQVEVAQGLVIDGQEITGEVDVELSGSDLPVTRPLDLVAVDGSMVTMRVDLNAQSWLALVDPATQTINEQVFADLVDVVVE